MRSAVIGGGPAGLYFALLIKKANPDDQVVVIERNPPDATFGWGVVFSEETLGALRDADYETYTRIQEGFARWTSIDIHYQGELVRSRGHVFTGISRKVLLNILQQRCCELGVDLSFQKEVSDLKEYRDYDLLVGADGINGLTRKAYADAFKPNIQVHRTKYVWFGTDLVFDAFTFIFRRNQHGLFQVHAYPFDGQTSTFIVECPEEAWKKAGLDTATEADSIRYCEELFADDLKGKRLLSNRSLWGNFMTLRSQSWHHENVVLLGDAAHTAHFSIGSGTKLAMEDAIALVDALRRRKDLKAALTDYEMERQPVVERFQEAARESSTYFEDVSRYAAFQPLQFAFNLLTRSRRITYVSLMNRDPELVRRVDSWFAAQASRSPNGRLELAPPPMFAPLKLRGLELANRVALAPIGIDAAVDGLVGIQHQAHLRAAAGSGAGLVITEFTAVSTDGRITSGSPGLFSAEQARVWKEAVDAVRADTRATICLQLGHAGRRGSMRPRRQGVDRPLRKGGWRVLSASAIPYTLHGSMPQEIDGKQMTKVKEEFVSAARAAIACGFDMLELNFGQGFLLGSFLSPLSNRRTDVYGGDLKNRLRYPLEVLDAVREAWPASAPIAVRLSAGDWVEGGFTLDDAVEVAAQLKKHGCDLIHAVMGQTVAECRPDYGRMFAVPAADRIRNEAKIPVLTSGNITTTDEVNTILDAGRADLCLMELS
jgi:anthraniloyl-CoA monooxygenase